MAGDAAFVVGPAMAAITAGRIKFSFDLVHGDEVAPVLEFPVRAVTIAGGRLHLNLVCVTFIAEGTLVAGGTEPVIRGCVETVILHE